MPLHFTVLASGSSGNASFIAADDFGLLLDVGLGPRTLASRLRAAGLSWQHIRAVLLTHTHTDHWNDRTFAHLQRLGITLYCHAEHHPSLLSEGLAFAGLRDAGLVCSYEPGVELRLAPGLRCLPFTVPHDSGLTCGFRFEAANSHGRPCALGYAADLGSWQGEVARHLANVDVLALEFNHDVLLERSSGRSPRLIARVLGDRGHLSNVQAAALVRQVLNLSEPGRLRHVVQLHLSRDCNRPALAVTELQTALGGLHPGLNIHTARQDQHGPMLTVESPGGNAPPPSGRSLEARSLSSSVQPLLPGWEE